MAASAYTDTVQKVYIAYYGRAADPVGLAYWSAAIDTAGGSIAAIMASFGASAEATTLYGSLTDTAKVNAIYQQTFGRDADFAGLMYYAGQLSAGTMTAVSIAQNIFDGASGTDATLLANKLVVAKAYTTAIDTSSEVVAYSGTVAAAAARTLLSTVDATTVTASFDVATSIASTVTASTAAAVVAGTSVSLTTNTDAAKGNSGNDTFESSYSTANGMTFQSSDTIDGGAGTDQINITVGVVGTHQASSLTNVETVKGTFSAAGTLSLLGSSGVATVSASGSTAAASVTNIPLGAALEIQNSGQNATFAYKASDVSGSSDTATVTLNNATAGTLTVAAIETLNVVSGGGGNILTGVTAAAANTINITGSQSLNLGVANTVAEMIDGSAATGVLTVITNNANAATVKTGSANDSITSTGGTATVVTIESGAGNDTITHTANLGSTDVINGGEGTDTLVGTTANLKALTVSATAPTITNMEAVTVSDEYVDSTSTLDTVNDIQATGITTVTLANVDTTAGDDITTGDEVLVMGAGAMTLNLGGSEAGNQSHLGGTLEVQDTGTATTDSLAIVNKSLNSSTGANVDIGDVVGASLGKAITSTGYESVSLDTGAGSANTEQTFSTLTITPDAVAANVSLTLTGTNAIDIVSGVSTTSTGLLTINASGLTAQAAGTTTFDLNSTAQGTAGTATITGSGGDDLITVGNFASTINAGAGTDVIIGGTAADTISGEAGNDNITGSGGNDVLNGGAGNDTIDASTAGNYTVTGGDGTDSVDFGSTLTQNDSFDGGDGTDTLTLTTTSVTAVKNLTVSQINTLNAGISNVEVLDFGTTLNQDIDLGRLDGLSSIRIGALAGASNLSGLAATNNIEVLANGTGAITLTLGDATGTADVVNVNLKASAVITQAVTAPNVETVNYVGNDAATANVSAINVSTLVATKATTVNVSGNDGLALTSTGSTKITTFDASGVVANDSGDTTANMAVTYTSANTSTTAAVSITGGAGNDTLEGNGSIDTIKGGAGDDIITATAGNDVVDGGAGADTVTFSDTLFDGNSATTATHTGGAGTDTLDLAATATIVDADFVRLSSFEALTFTAGTNTLTVAAEADATGILSITGGTGVETIDASSVDFDNALTITGGDGADIITLGDRVDTLGFSLANGADGGALITVTNVANTADDFNANTADAVTAFTSGTDKINISGALLTAINGTNDSANGTDSTAIALADNGTVDMDAGVVFIFDTADDLAADNFGDASAIFDISNSINSGTAANGTANQEYLFAVGNNSGTHYGLYYHDDVNGNIDAGIIAVNDKITLIGVFATATLAASDFTFG